MSIGRLWFLMLLLVLGGRRLRPLASGCHTTRPPCSRCDRRCGLTRCLLLRSALSRRGTTAVPRTGRNWWHGWWHWWWPLKRGYVTACCRWHGIHLRPTGLAWNETQLNRWQWSIVSSSPPRSILCSFPAPDHWPLITNWQCT